MITDGRYYCGMTGEGPEGNEKYSADLKRCIEEAGELCLGTINDESFSPGMLLGSIQSGKTRGFIGLMSLCFDNDFDMTIILTKCSKALVQQTVKRMTGEFDIFRTGNSTAGDVIAQDILDIDFTGARNMIDKESAVVRFLNRYKRKKRIIVVKKQADNVDRMNMFIEQLVKGADYKRILIIDDEADVTSIGFEKNKEIDELTLRRISGAINTARMRLNSKIEYALMQVTATPYALYLQPEVFSNDDVMPIKPARTVVMPTGENYIGGRYYFLDSQDEESPNYDRAKYLLQMVPQEEMSIINGTAKNSGKNSRIKDGRTVKKEKFISGHREDSDFALPSLRSWIFDILVGTAIIQLNEGFEEYYVSAVMHAATAKPIHKAEVELLKFGVDEIQRVLNDDIDDNDVKFYVNESYARLSESVEAYNVLKLPSVEDVRNRIAAVSNGEIEGLITEIDVKEVNSDSDIMKLLNDDGELRLESSITVFVGGQVLDRGITIPNMVNFFYGRDPKTMQQDTVTQHCRMFGYRGAELLSVTRFYTTNRLYNNMREITIRDEILRQRIEIQDESNVIYLEAGGDIKPCSPAKILASDINNIMPQRRYLPIGFDVKGGKREADAAHKRIFEILDKHNAILDKKSSSYRKGESTTGRYVTVDPEVALEILRLSYESLEPDKDGMCNEFNQIEPAFLFAISELVSKGENRIALIVRENRSIRKYKKYGDLYQDAPDDGNNEGALAAELRKEMPVLVMTEQTHPDWKYKFWWPVFYTPNDMSVGIYAEPKSNIHVGENLFSVVPRPVGIEAFVFVDNIDMDVEVSETIRDSITQICDYYNRAFAIDDATTAFENRKTKVTCPIYLDDINSSGDEATVTKNIVKAKDKAMRILDAGNIGDSQIEPIVLFFDSAIEAVLTDEINDSAFKCVESLGLKKYMEGNLLHLLEMVNDLLYRRGEFFGLFVPQAYNRFEIHIFKGAIEYYLDDIGKRSDDNVKAMIISTIAHEIFHAFHYADTMTESGKWLYTRKGYKKQLLTQESLAEYFCLSYCKQANDSELKKGETIIREMRDISNFPDDPYAGCMQLEKVEKGGAGNSNPVFVKAYESSLKDMYLANDIIVEGE